MNNEEQVRVTSHGIKDMLDSVQADKDAKKVFLNMPREEQLLAILGMIAYTNSVLANVQKEQIEQRAALNSFKDEVRNSREERKQIEKDLADKLGVDFRFTDPEDETLTTTQKVMAVIARRLDFWKPILQHSISIVLDIVILALLYLAFGGKLPTP